LAKAREVKGIRCQGTVIQAARRIIDVRIEELLGWAEYVHDPRNIEQIHNLRISAKRLRYTLEMFAFAFPPELKGYIDEIKKIQEHIGDMRDADVMIQKMSDAAVANQTLRSQKLLEIATTTSRGTVAQRHQRLKSALASPKGAQDEIAYYTLIAQRTDVRERAYDDFIRTWERLEAASFFDELTRFVGRDPEPETVEQAVDVGEASGDGRAVDEDLVVVAAGTEEQASDIERPSDADPEAGTGR
jgi:hypothetical protein